MTPPASRLRLISMVAPVIASVLMAAGCGRAGAVGGNGAAASCVGPSLTATSRDTGTVRLSGEYFVLGCEDSFDNGTAQDPWRPAGPLTVRLTAGGSTTTLGTVTPTPPGSTDMGRFHAEFALPTQSGTGTIAVGEPDRGAYAVVTLTWPAPAGP